MVSCCRVRFASEVLREVGEVHVNGPDFSGAEVGEMCRIGPEHQAKNNLFKLAAWLVWLFLQVVMQLDPRIRRIYFVKAALFRAN